jgi:plastocyanin
VPAVRNLTVLALLLASALATGAAQAQPAGRTVVNLVFGDNRYDPKVIELKVGQEYLLHITNPTVNKHGLEAKEFFDSVTFPDWSKGRVKNGDLEVWPGQWNEVDFTPQTPGEYPMHSPDPMNQILGMVGTIVVR